MKLCYGFYPFNTVGNEPPDCQQHPVPLHQGKQPVVPIQTKAIVSQWAHFKLKHWQRQAYKPHLYAVDSPCPSHASYSLMPPLPRRDPSAVWAIKQRERSHFLFITTDCYLSLQLPPSLLPPCILVENLHTSLYCFYNGCILLISCWVGEHKKHILHTDNIQRHMHWTYILCTHTDMHTYTNIGRT